MQLSYILVTALLPFWDGALAGPSHNRDALIPRHELAARYAISKDAGNRDNIEHPPANTTELLKRGDKEPELECTDIENRKYLAAQHLENRIEWFCKDAEKQGKLDKDSGAITREYYWDTPEQVIIAMDFPPGSDYKPDYNECKKQLRSVADNCSRPDERNRHNNKAGGSIKVGDVKYRVEPQKLRQHLDKNYMGGCGIDNRVAFLDVTVWGAGWAMHDHGEELKGQMKACILYDWSIGMQYGMGSDGREWTVRFRIAPGQHVCINAAVRESGAPQDTICS